MFASSLDRRVRKEADALVREARGALARKSSLRGKRDELETRTAAIEKALASDDLVQLRRHMPALDAAVDDVIVRPVRSSVRDTVESIFVAVLIALLLRAFVVEAFKIPSSSMYPTLEINDHIFVNKFVYGIRIPWTNIKLFERSPKRGDVIVFMMPCVPDKDYIKRVVAVAGDTVEVRCEVVYVNGVAIPSTLVDRETTYLDEQDGRRVVRTVSRREETVGDKTHDVFQTPVGSTRVEESPGFPELVEGEARPLTCLDYKDPDNPGRPRTAAPNQKPGALVSTRTGAGACEQQLHYVVPEGHVFAMGDNRPNSNDSRFWGSVPIENIKGEAMFIWLSYEHLSLTDWSGVQPSRIGNFVE
jgi:signal peptidase I